MTCCRNITAKSRSSSSSDGTSTAGVGGLGMGFSILCKNLSGLGSSSPFSLSAFILCYKNDLRDEFRFWDVHESISTPVSVQSK